NAVLETYGGGATETALRRALAAGGPAPNAGSIGGASDHASFQRAGIEVGGVFTGASGRVSRASAERFGARAGRPADPCYHQACGHAAQREPGDARAGGGCCRGGGAGGGAVTPS